MTDYPTNADLRRLREWAANDPHGWFDFARSIWWAADWGWSQTYDGIDDHTRPITVHLISTGGWSGNEAIIDAMQDHHILWSKTWYSHRIGGHYEFRVHRRAEEKP